ncbi:MAG: TolC family protein [Elusimicrobia bacterium]|nr:TolC family protein [Elusimicrobiota bacterium]
MTVTLFLCLIVFVFPSRSAPPIHTQSGQAEKRILRLSDAVRLALLNNPRILSAQKDITIAEQRVKEARSLFFPEVGFGANLTKFDAQRLFLINPDIGPQVLDNRSPDKELLSGRVFLRQSIYSGGRYVHTLQLAQAALKQARARDEAAKMDVLFEVKQLYYRLLMAQEALRLCEERFAQAQAEFAQGQGFSGWEALSAHETLTQMRSECAERRQELHGVQLEFLKTVNLELDVSVSVEAELLQSPVDLELPRAIVWALELRPELQSETYKAQMDAIAVNLAMSERIPTITLLADYEVVGPEFLPDRTNWHTTLSVRFPFSYHFWSQIRQKRAEQRQGELNRAALQDRVRLEVRQAYSAHQFWLQEADSRKKEWERLQALYAREMPGFGRFRRLQALSWLLNSQLRYLEGRTRRWIYQAQLERAVGKEL